MAWWLPGNITAKSLRSLQTSAVVKGHLDRFLDVRQGGIHYVESVALTCPGNVLDPPDALRFLMLADVQILIGSEPDVPPIPAQAVVQHQGRFFCLAKVAEKYQTRELQIRSIIGHTATIQQGLTFGDIVVVNPWEVGNLLDLPKKPALPPASK